jgi:hypothetical protein
MVMNDAQFKELAGRIDGVGRTLALLIADLEMRECLNGDRFCQSLRNSANGRGQYPQHEKSAQVMLQIADELDGARRSRAAAHQHESPSGHK